jgi:hypothetical protein
MGYLKERILSGYPRSEEVTFQLKIQKKTKEKNGNKETEQRNAECN